MDSTSFAAKLIQFKSVTPEDDGVFDYVSNLLKDNGFMVDVVEFEEQGYDTIKNLYAEIGSGSKNLTFAGHLDVVPVGDANAWTVDPFGGIITNGNLYGRGASDMKAGVAAWICAAIRASHELKSDYKISVMLTGDEESIAINGTKKLLKYLDKKNIKLDGCIVGEPTCEKKFGDTIKIGRRGSATFEVVANGVQGHVAYPHLAKNPVHILTKAIVALKSLNLDDGTPEFQPSNLECVNIEVGNKASNVIPAHASAIVNIRHNTIHTAASLLNLLQDTCSSISDDIKITLRDESQAFLSGDLSLAEMLADVAQQHTKIPAKLTTTGGTSDARFIHKYCPVAELGLLNATAHKIDEHVSVEDIALLEEIYYKLIIRYFS